MGDDDGDRRGRRPQVVAHEPVPHVSQQVRRPERIDQVSSRSAQAAPASRTIDLSGVGDSQTERHSPHCGGWLTGHGLRRSRSPRLAPYPQSQSDQRCAARNSPGVAAVRRRTSPHAPGRSCSPLTVLDHVAPSLGSSGAPDAPPPPFQHACRESVLKSPITVGMPMLVRLTARHKSRRNGWRCGVPVVVVRAGPRSPVVRGAAGRARRSVSHRSSPARPGTPRPVGEAARHGIWTAGPTTAAEPHRTHLVQLIGSCLLE